MRGEILTHYERFVTWVNVGKTRNGSSTNATTINAEIMALFISELDILEQTLFYPSARLLATRKIDTIPTILDRLVQPPVLPDSPIIQTYLPKISEFWISTQLLNQR